MHCWEFHKCGKQKKGCPAFPGSGKNCALVAGTIGSGQPLFTFGQKEERCRQCAFFRSKHYAEEYEPDIAHEPF
ncbi:two-CW domain-containing protein [Thiovibrio sp. JS02]